MKMMGIQGPLAEWIFNFLSERKQKILANEVAKRRLDIENI